MFLQFIRGKPLQACKLITIIATLLYVASATIGLLPNRGFSAILFVIVFSLSLALLITVEAVVAGFRAIRAVDPLTHQFADRRGYVVIRTGEVVIAILAAGVFVVTFSLVTSEPMAGPGALGLAFFGAGLSVLILGASLIRTLTEYYYHRRTPAG